MKKHFVAVLAAPLMMFALAMPSAADSTATKTCSDGTVSTAKGKGACSGHGGVQKAVKASAGTTGAMAGSQTTESPAKLTPPPATAAGPAAATAAPSGSTAKCKDGTYSSAKSHSGACSKHGGVADFLTPGK